MTEIVHTESLDVYSNPFSQCITEGSSIFVTLMLYQHITRQQFSRVHWTRNVFIPFNTVRSQGMRKDTRQGKS